MHTGLDPLTISQAVALLAENGINFSAEELLTLDGFCRLRRELDNQPTQFLDSRIRRFQTFAEVRMEKARTLVWDWMAMQPGHPLSVNTAIL